MNRRALLTALASVPLALTFGSARAADRIPVVASFSILADMVRQVGGDRVAVTALVGPNGDAHVYQPTPGDAKAVAGARLLVVNGLGFEGWMTRLSTSSGFKGTLVTASRGIAPQTMTEAHGPAGRAAAGRATTDPHAWQNLANGRIYAANIRDGLVAADPENRATYEANARTYLAAIDALEPAVRSGIAAIPPARRRVITSHDAFGYFARAYGLDFIAPNGVSTESEASARDVAKIIRQIKAERIPAIFVENVSDRRLQDQIARETGARIGGTLYSDALSAADGPAGTYLDMFRHNLRMLTAALVS